MAGTGFTVAIEEVGFKRAAAMFSRMGMAAGDAIPFWEEEVIPDLEMIEFQVFKSQGRRGGGSWKFLSQETIDTKVRKNQSPLINIATGTLMTSVSVGGGMDVPEYGIREVTPGFVRFGSTAPGATQSQRNRPYMRWTHFDRARWARWFIQYIVRTGKETA